MIIGLNGPRYSGKTEVVKILVGEGFTSLSFGDEVRLERNARNLPKNYDLHNLGVNLIDEFGPKYWGLRVAGRIEFPLKKNYVVDGMRTLGDLEVFRTYPEFNLVGITADLDIRWARCKLNQRGRLDDVNDYEDFIQRCKRDESSFSGGLQSAELFSKRDQTLENNGSIEELKLRVFGLY